MFPQWLHRSSSPFLFISFNAFGKLLRKDLLISFSCQTMEKLNLTDAFSPRSGAYRVAGMGCWGRHWVVGPTDPVPSVDRTLLRRTLLQLIWNWEWVFRVQFNHIFNHRGDHSIATHRPYPSITFSKKNFKKKYLKIRFTFMKLLDIYFMLSQNYLPLERFWSRLQR